MNNKKSTVLIFSLLLILSSWGPTTAQERPALNQEPLAVPSAGARGITWRVNVPFANLVLNKEFTDDPAVAGGSATLQFTLSNLDTSQPATGIDFTDNLATALPGLTFNSLVSNTCGGERFGGGF